MVAEQRNEPRLCIVVPCYNEEDTLPHSFKALLEVLERLRENRHYW